MWGRDILYTYTFVSQSEGPAVRPQIAELHPTLDLNISFKPLRACEDTTAELVGMFICEHSLHILIKEREQTEVHLYVLMEKRHVTHLWNHIKVVI